ncbi:sigma-70 family RNA polymerase sigma factor [Methylogaea oryzae]|uniref:sigma-70 family RNA polymerase sigma factor n=1 Tax=Methylogaea oryzae TaxID=1295382 RepID=UPI00402B5D65
MADPGRSPSRGRRPGREGRNRVRNGKPHGALRRGPGRQRRRGRQRSDRPIHYLKHETADPAAELEAGEWDRRQQLLLRDALDQLDERSREIVASRWLNEEKLTLHQLADRYNVSAERIRQLEKNAMDKLRSRLLVAM